MPVIEARGLVKHNGEVEAIGGIDLAVEPGEVSGSGLPAPGVERLGLTVSGRVVPPLAEETSVIILGLLLMSYAILNLRRRD